ncbi:MAG TPA: C39 family peptidase [Stenomitos sp.]
MRRIGWAIAVSGLILALCTGVAGALPAGNQFFISQMRDPAWNPEGPEWSANCGPACLAMAFKAFGSVDPKAPPQALIRHMRRAITGSANDLDVTSLDDVRQAAERFGLETGLVYGPEAVQAALQAGRLVIAAGNPRAYNARFAAKDYQAFSGAHFVLVTQADADGYWINDPLSRVGALHITAPELAAFMGYRRWDVGLSLAPPQLKARQVLLEAQR